MISENEILLIDNNLFMIPFCSHCSMFPWFCQHMYSRTHQAAYMHYFIMIIFHRMFIIFSVFCVCVCALSSFAIHDSNFIWMDSRNDFLCPHHPASSVQHHLSNICCAVNENAVLPFKKRMFWLFVIWYYTELQCVMRAFVCWVSVFEIMFCFSNNGPLTSGIPPYSLSD